MSETIYTKKQERQISFEEQAAKENVFFSKSLEGFIDEETREVSKIPETSDILLTLGDLDFNISSHRINRDKEAIFIDFKIHGFSIKNFIDFPEGFVSIFGKTYPCTLCSYESPTDDSEYGLIRIFLHGVHN